MNLQKNKKKYWCDFCGKHRVLCTFTPIIKNKKFRFTFIYKCLDCGTLMVKKERDTRKGFIKANNFLEDEIGPGNNVEDFVRI